MLKAPEDSIMKCSCRGIDAIELWNKTSQRKPVHKETWTMARDREADFYTATFFSYRVYLGGLALKQAHFYYAH